MLMPVQARATQFTPSVRANTFSRGNQPEQTVAITSGSDGLSQTQIRPLAEMGMVSHLVAGIMLAPLRVIFQNFVIGNTGSEAQQPLVNKLDLRG